MIFYLVCNKLHPSEVLYPMDHVIGIQPLRGIYFVVDNSKNKSSFFLEKLITHLNQ